MKNLSKEEKQKEKENGLNNIKRKIPYLNTPSYFFNKIGRASCRERV